MKKIYVTNANADDILVSPRTKTYDMVCAKIGNSTYLSPQISTNNSKLRSALMNKNGLHRFVRLEDETWAYNPDDVEFNGMYAHDVLTSAETVTTEWIASNVGVSVICAASDSIKKEDAFNIYLLDQSVSSGTVHLKVELWYERYGEVFSITVQNDFTIYRPSNGVYGVSQLDGNEFAKLLYERIKNRHYQPFSVEGAFLRLDTELGDTVETNGAYSLLAEQTINFGNLMKMDIGTPSAMEMHASKSSYARSFSMTIDI